MSSETRVIRTGCSNDCGGRCVLLATVRDGKLVHIDSDPAPDHPNRLQLRACLRGRSYRQIVYHPDRLRQPLKRVGRRGEGKFAPIAWDEALSLIAEQTRRITERYGALSHFVMPASGMMGVNKGADWARRLLGLYCGDYLGKYGSYSWGQTAYATELTYGTVYSANHVSDLVNSRLIILAGHNPAETIFGTNGMMHYRSAKEAGARLVVIDPRYTDTAATLADEWIPILPSTDAALFAAMAYVILTEGLQNQPFLDRYCMGFDEAHMPPGIPGGLSFRSYLLGGAGEPAKTPAWAESMTGVPAERIVRLAREYALAQPAALIQGQGLQRHTNGEQTARMGIALAAMTGNVGVHGGWASGAAGWPETVVLDRIPSQGGAIQIPFFLWTDAIFRGAEMTAEVDLIRGADRLPGNIKCLWNLAGNVLINQHANINRTAALLADESLVEFILTSDLFLTPSARFSDIVLPATSYFERPDIVQPWNQGDYIIYMNQVLEPLAGCRNEYDWMSELADRLGCGADFTLGRDITDWLRACCAITARRHTDFPGFDRFREQGIFRTEINGPGVAFERQISDPERCPFATPSGKIEIFSRKLFDRGEPARVPAVPQYVACDEGPAPTAEERFPLQLIGWHSRNRTHSTHENNPWMNEVQPRQLWINPADAARRGVTDGANVRVWNQRGSIQVIARVTPRVLPGVVALPEGGWWRPSAGGEDLGGAINILTTHEPSPMSHSNPQNTTRVQVQKMRV